MYDRHQHLGPATAALAANSTCGWPTFGPGLHVHTRTTRWSPRRHLTICTTAHCGRKSTRGGDRTKRLLADAYNSHDTTIGFCDHCANTMEPGDKDAIMYAGAAGALVTRADNLHHSADDTARLGLAAAIVEDAIGIAHQIETNEPIDEQLHGRIARALHTAIATATGHRDQLGDLGNDYAARCGAHLLAVRGPERHLFQQGRSANNELAREQVIRTVIDEWAPMGQHVVALDLAREREHELDEHGAAHHVFARQRYAISHDNRPWVAMWGCGATVLPDGTAVAAVPAVLAAAAKWHRIVDVGHIDDTAAWALRRGEVDDTIRYAAKLGLSGTAGDPLHIVDQLF